MTGNGGLSLDRGSNAPIEGHVFETLRIETKAHHDCDTGIATGTTNEDNIDPRQGNEQEGKGSQSAVVKAL